MKPRSHQEKAFVRHNEDFQLGKELKINLKIVRNFSKYMVELVVKWCHIMSTEADICTNGKLDHSRPVVHFVEAVNLGKVKKNVIEKSFFVRWQQNVLISGCVIQLSLVLLVYEFYYFYFT